MALRSESPMLEKIAQRARTLLRESSHPHAEMEWAETVQRIKADTLSHVPNAVSRPAEGPPVRS